MKTCEEYVLQELAEAKEKIAALEAENADLLKGGKLFLGFLNVLKKYMHEEEGSSGLNYITMNYVFEQYETEDFELLQAVLIALEEDDDE